MSGAVRASNQRVRPGTERQFAAPDAPPRVAVRVRARITIMADRWSPPTDATPRAVAVQIRAFMPRGGGPTRRWTPMATDASDFRSRLREHFEVNRRTTSAAAAASAPERSAVRVPVSRASAARPSASTVCARRSKVRRTPGGAVSNGHAETRAWQRSRREGAPHRDFDEVTVIESCWSSPATGGSRAVADHGGLGQAPRWRSPRARPGW